MLAWLPISLAAAVQPEGEVVYGPAIASGGHEPRVVWLESYPREKRCSVVTARMSRRDLVVEQRVPLPTPCERAFAVAGRADGVYVAWAWQTAFTNGRELYRVDVARLDEAGVHPIGVPLLEDLPWVEGVLVSAEEGGGVAVAAVTLDVDHSHYATTLARWDDGVWAGPEVLEDVRGQDLRRREHLELAAFGTDGRESTAMYGVWTQGVWSFLDCPAPFDDAVAVIGTDGGARVFGGPPETLTIDPSGRCDLVTTTTARQVPPNPRPKRLVFGEGAEVLAACNAGRVSWVAWLGNDYGYGGEWDAETLHVTRSRRERWHGGETITASARTDRELGLVCDARHLGVAWVGLDRDGWHVDYARFR